MTAFPNLRGSDSAPQLLGEPRSRYEIDCAGAQLHVHARSVATVLRIEGDVDAYNAGLLTETIRRFSRLRAPLILDLTDLDFMSVAGLTAVELLSREARRANVRCVVVDGSALRRITRVLPARGLSLADSVPTALRDIDRATRARRRFASRLASQQEPQGRPAVVNHSIAGALGWRRSGR
ncbi:STAS domain-containing protein [Mycobacterium sp. E2462]|uniref:STAS domain-containing protein n=1 Tax=Mycobacterium sp. E2462 TaxID=1834133 RepID=UPI0009ED8364|nr:STAS domain-containing protein [Mycobacterium sp. E2462]